MAGESFWSASFGDGEDGLSSSGWLTERKPVFDVVVLHLASVIPAVSFAPVCEDLIIQAGKAVCIYCTYGLGKCGNLPFTSAGCELRFALGLPHLADPHKLARIR